MARLRIGTRKSAMALAQTDEIARQLSRAVPGIDVEIVKFETTGDIDQTGKLVIPTRFDANREFAEGLAPVMVSPTSL